MSRLPYGSQTLSAITPDMMKAICQCHQEDVNLIEITAMNIHITDNISEETEYVNSLSYQRWRQALKEDADIHVTVQDDLVPEQDQAEDQAEIKAFKDEVIKPRLIPRQSMRISKPPKHFDDYVLQQQTVNSLATGLEAKSASKTNRPIPAPRHSEHLPVPSQSVPVTFKLWC